MIPRIHLPLLQTLRSPNLRSKMFCSFSGRFSHIDPQPTRATTTTFDDDEPLTSKLPPSPLPPSSSSSVDATVTTIPELPAVAAPSSLSTFPVLVSVRAPPAPAASRDRAPIDLTAVLDVSGSMQGNKIALLKRAVNFIVRNLDFSDRLSIVSFSDDSNRVLRLSCMTDTGRDTAFTAVESLKAGGSTNIKSGLEMGIRVLDQRHHRNPVPGIILLSDGQDTTSKSSYSYLLPSNTTVPIHTFGFGTDHDPKAMHTIAEASGATFSFIEAEGDVQDAFAMCIGGLLSVTSQKVELMVSSVGGVRIDSISSGSYRSRVINHGLAGVVEFGDLYADEVKDILVHVSVPAADAAQSETPLLTVKCSYKNPLTQEAVHVDGETAVIQRPDVLLPEDGVVNLKVDRQRNRLMVGESIREAQEMAERWNFEGAKELLTSRRAALLATPSAQAGDGLCGWLDSELTEIQKRMENRPRVYEKSGRAYATSSMWAHSGQRAAAGAMMGCADSFSTSMGAAGSRWSVSDSNIGYQTDAMREMLKKSMNSTPEDPLAKTGDEQRQEES